MFGLLGGWFLAGRMLAPLDAHHRRHPQGRGAARSRTGSSCRAAEDEFRELADAFDAMLARLEAHVAEQRRFAANASHELRTPLATTQALLDVARTDPTATPDELLERLRVVNARAIDLTEALLLLSRADQRSFTRERVDLSLLAEEAAETLLPLAEQRGITLETSGDVTPGRRVTRAPAADDHEPRAQRDRPQPARRRHRVGQHRGPAAASVALTVENTGETLAPAAGLDAHRAVPARHRTHPHGDHAGVGLGLAIVKSITRAHDGTLTLTPRAAGGLCIAVALPAAPSETDR